VRVVVGTQTPNPGEGRYGPVAGAMGTGSELVDPAESLQGHEKAAGYGDFGGHLRLALDFPSGANRVFGVPDS
jgi:hypothetical protein